MQTVFSCLTLTSFLVLLASPVWAAETSSGRLNWSALVSSKGLHSPTLPPAPPATPSERPSWVEVLYGDRPPVPVPAPEPPAPPSPWTPTATIAYCREVGIIGARVEVALFETKLSPVDVAEAELRRKPPVAITNLTRDWPELVRLMVSAIHHKTDGRYFGGPQQVKNSLESLCLKEPVHLMVALKYPDQIKWRP